VLNFVTAGAGGLLDGLTELQYNLLLKTGLLFFKPWAIRPLVD